MQWSKGRTLPYPSLCLPELNGIVARKEALEWGVFRGEGEEKRYTPAVGLGEAGRYTPLPTLPGAPELNRVFSRWYCCTGILPTL